MKKDIKFMSICSDTIFKTLYKNSEIGIKTYAKMVLMRRDDAFYAKC